MQYRYAKFFATRYLQSAGERNVSGHMRKRHALKGVAYGLVDTFVSRNNDVSGYWGIGQLIFPR